MTDELTLEIDGAAFGGWKSVQVARSIEAAAGSFRLEVSERFPGDATQRSIRPGSRAVVRIGADVVITGHIDVVEKRLGPTQQEVMVAGRDAAGDLVDSAPDVAPGEWLGLTVLQVAQSVAGPFGIPVRAEASVGEIFQKASLSPGTTAWAFLEELCRYRALLPISDGLGALVLTRAGTSRTAEALVEGENILGGSASLSWIDRHDEVIVKAQVQGNEFLAELASAQPEGRARDPEIDRHRPKVVVAASGASQQRCVERARWETVVRAGRGSSAQVMVAGWRQLDGAGQLWPINALVPLRSPALGVNRDMLISGVQFLLDGSGRRTRLDLVRPDAFARIEEPEPAESGLGFDLGDLG